LQAAIDWAGGRNLEILKGPKGLLSGDGLGILVEGFEHRPAIGIAYNPPYYLNLLQVCGFEKESNYFSGVPNGPISTASACCPNIRALVLILF
jgi:hypothetical protein